MFKFCAALTVVGIAASAGTAFAQGTAPAGDSYKPPARQTGTVLPRQTAPAPKHPMARLRTPPAQVAR